MREPLFLFDAPISRKRLAVHEDGGTDLPRRSMRLRPDLEEERQVTRRACSVCRVPGHKAPNCPQRTGQAIAAVAQAAMVVELPRRASGPSPTIEGTKQEGPRARAARLAAECPRVKLIRARALELKRRQQDRLDLDAEIARLARALPPDADDLRAVNEEAAADPPVPFAETADGPTKPGPKPRWKRRGLRKRLPTENPLLMRRLIRPSALLRVRRELDQALELHEKVPRPKVWGDCRPAGAYYINGVADHAEKDGPLRWWTGACPWAGCKWNLGATVNPTGSITYLQGLDDGLPTCVLELAGSGAHTLEQVGELDGITRERARQIETRALRAGQRARVLRDED